MSDPTQSVEGQLAEIRSTLRGLAMTVEQLSGIVRILDQYMILNKKFFDQVQVNEPPKVETKVEEKK